MSPSSALRARDLLLSTPLPRRCLRALAVVSDATLGIRLQQLTAQRQAELDRALAAARAAELARFQREMSNRD